MTSRLFWQLSAAVLAVILLGVVGFGAVHYLFPGQPPAVRPPTEANPQTLAKQAGAILQTNCHRCHGQDGVMEGGFNYVLDRQRLVERHKIVPGQPEQSKLLRRVHDGEMPPAEEKQRPSPNDVAVLRRWIEAGAPDFQTIETRSETLPLAELPRLIRDDLARLPERDRRFARYFTLTHLLNNGLAEDELQTYRQALSKLVNSLSWGREIVIPHPVDPARTVLRIDLRDYKWESGAWERILADYPYGVTTDDETGRAMAAAADCRLPYVRADWFTATASRPPLYYDLLQMPATDRELETLLRVDAAQEIRGERVVRAGFNNSGVSRNNRVIERFDSSYGAYWRSYDFGGGAGSKNIFAGPLGPGGGPNAFQPDGGELIFELPNGLHAYLLVDGGGKRLDQVSTEIVSDPKRPERAVVAGLSCLSCHSRGLNDKADQIREHVLKNPGAFPKEETDAVLALYPPHEQFEEVLNKDVSRYRRALEKTGARWGPSDPIETLAARFEADVDLPLAAAEAGVSTRELADAITSAPELGRALGSIRSEGGTVPRKVFADLFGDLLRSLKRGEPLRPDGFSLATTVKERTVVDLPEPFADVKTGGGGRFFIFYLKKAKKLAIFDVLQAKIVYEIDIPADDVRFAAGRDKLLVVLPGEKVVQRYDLRTFQREKTAPVPGGGSVQIALMGYNSQGPLALWSGDAVELLDVDKMEPMEIEGGGIGGRAQYGFTLRVSPDGQVFVAWHNGIYPSSFAIMRLNGRKATMQRFDGGSQNERWVMPNADGSNLIEGISHILSENLNSYAASDLKDWVVLATADPRFFLAASGLQVSICTTSDRRRVFSVTEKSMQGMNRASGPTSWFLFNREEARVRFLPDANLLVFLPMDDKQIVVRPFDLMRELEKDGKEYLFLPSRPKTHAKAGTLFVYQIEVKSKSAGVTYKLENGPEGMTASAGGEVRWNVPPGQAGKTTPVIISVKNAGGKESLHTFDLTVE
jgi:mono/diheme cytochrome c family protein